MVELTLARNFPPADEAAWKALVEEALKGTPFASLRSKSYDGIAIEPLYPRAQGRSRIEGRAAGAAWAVTQRIDLPDAKAANSQALDDLGNGANALTLVFEGSIGDYGYALPATGAAISEALDNVHLDAGIAIDLDLSMQSKDAAGLIATLVKARGLTPKDVTIRFGFGPIGGIAMSGQSPLPWTDIAPIFAGLIGDLAGQDFAGPFAVADGRVIHAAGGSEAQELAFALASAVAYLRAMEQGGIALESARSFIYFRLATDQDQFLTIAKLRGIRKLWSRIEQACGLTPHSAFVAAETAWRMMTKRDPHGNIVRGTIAALAAAVGGADAVTVLPFSAALGIPDAFARRVARNTQLILIEEANLHRVADPAAGSGAIEALTDELCRVAWDLFQGIERAGGAAKALEAGSIQKQVARVRAEREANVARREDTLVGTSDFPDLAEDKVPVLGTPRLSIINADEAALPRHRVAESFERLRDRSDDHLARRGTRPKVFLACLGRAADFNARASFAKSLFEAGGIEAVSYDGAAASPLPGGERSTPTESGEGDQHAGHSANPSPGPSPAAPARPLPMGEVKTEIAALAEAFKASGAKLACLCSSDRVYARKAVDAAQALAAARAKHIYLAGKAGPDRAALEGAGIGSFLHQGCDTLAILESAYDSLD